MFDVVLDRLPQLLPSPQAPVFAAIDDTILKRTGRRIPGVKILRDPMSPPFRVNLRYGLRFVQVSALVSPCDRPGPARALPVRFHFAPPANKPKKNAPPEAWKHYKESKRSARFPWPALRRSIACAQVSIEGPKPVSGN